MAYVPGELIVGGVELVDVRHYFPPTGLVARRRPVRVPLGVAVHHDGVLMGPGDRHYSGTTLDEDLERLRAIYRHGLSMGWGGMPYHVMASPNGRCFYTLDLAYYGAHVARRNHELVGLCLMGNFMFRHPGDLQLCAAARGLLGMWGWYAHLLPFRGHREWALPGDGTVCPGDTWWVWQNRLLVMTVAVARVLFP